MLSKEVQHKLHPPATGVKLFITIGNDLRGDDGVGPMIAENLTNLPKGTLHIFAGEKPENFIDEAIDHKPAEVIFIDAADFGGERGEVRIIPEENISSYILSTHTFPIPVIARIIREDAGCLTTFIGIQTKDISLGAKLCEEVKEAGENIVRTILGE